MSNFEHGAASVAELNAGIDAARHALQAATATGDSAAAASASADVSRLANELIAAEGPEAIGRADDVAGAKTDLLVASSDIAARATDNLNRALRHVGIPHLIDAGEETIMSVAYDLAVARQRLVQDEQAVSETAAALAHLDDAIAETESRRSAAVLAYFGGNRREEALKKIATLAKCLADLRAARVAGGRVESGEALREVAMATALLDRRQAQVLARVAKQHIAHAEAATTAAYAAAEKLGEITDRHLGAGAWAKLLAG